MTSFQPGYKTYVAFGTSGSETNISSIGDSADVQDGTNKLDVTAFGDTGKKTDPGLTEASFKYSGKWDATTIATLQGLIRVKNKSLIVGPGGNSTGDLKYSNSTAWLAAINVKSAVNGIVQADLEFCVNGTWTYGTF